MMHSNRPLVFAPVVFVFLLCIFLYRYFTRKKIIDITINKDKPICAVKTDFVSQVYISASKYMNKITIPSAQKTGACGDEYLLFFCYPSVCSKLENQAKCDSAVFVTNPLKIHFSPTF